MNNNKIRFIDSAYNDLFTIPNGGAIKLTLSDGEEITRTCKYIDAYHTQIGYDVYHICEFAEIMERNSTKYEPVSEKCINEKYVFDNYEEFQKDKFFIYPESKTVVLVYYNPDCNVGGQLVYNNIDCNLIKEASKFNDTKKFFDHLDSCCKQTLVDIDSMGFKDSANSFVNKKCEYIGSNENTMKALLKFADVQKEKAKHYNCER